MVKINIPSRTLYTIIGAIILVALAVGVNAYNSGGPPSVMGHSAEEIEGFEESADFSQCIVKRGEASRKGKVLYCPSNKKNIFHCSVSDNQAPEENSANPLPTRMPPGRCNVDGDCSPLYINQERTGLGTSFVYLELIEHAGVEGCWAYSSNNDRSPYKLDIVCC